MIATIGRKNTESQKITWKQIIFLLLVAVVTISVFSKSSFLYPLNDWVDANCFMTVGKSILNGIVLYRDIYEQKGPVLYFLHSVAALVSPTSFIGVYFIEIIACFFVLYFLFKIARLYYDRQLLCWMPALSFFMYSSTNFSHGDSAEELCLPFLTYALFLGIRWIKLRTKPSHLEFIIVGITSGVVLWIKYTCLGLYIGWIIIPLFLWIKNREFKQMFLSLLEIFLGVIIVSAPVLFYFWYNDALNDLFTVYFYNNMFVYGSTSNTNIIINYVLWGGCSFAKHNVCLFIFILLSWFFFRKIESDKVVCCQIFITFISAMLFIFIGPFKKYYSFILNIYAVFGYCFLSGLLGGIISKHKALKKIVPILFCILAFALSIMQSSNTYLMFTPKEDLPQYKFKETVEKCSPDQDITLLNYGFLDGGFYTVLGAIPSTRFFCQLNIELPEMYEEMEAAVENATVEYVVTRDSEISYEDYQLIDQASFPFEGVMRQYYLYKRVND